MIVVSLVIVLFAILLLQDNMQLTTSVRKRYLAVILFIIAGVVLSEEYGNLRSVFILIGLVSVVGTLFTLLRKKVSDNR